MTDHGQQPENAGDALRALAATHSLGTIVNTVDTIAATFGMDALPPSALTAGRALNDLLRDLGIVDGRHPLAADTYRSAQ